MLPQKPSCEGMARVGSLQREMQLWQGVRILNFTILSGKDFTKQKEHL